MKTSMRYLAVIFAVAMMLCALTVSANTFEDVKSDTPHAKAIESLTSLGIIHGYEDNTFKPTLPVRRDEMAKLVYTTFTTSTDAGDGVVTFPDVPSNNWAKGYISWCAGKSIVGGYEDGTFKPEGNVTYDEALKMVCAMLGYTDFNSEIWPIDVRLKALIDLNLGEDLADVAGDAALTRAQVAQLFHNALDEQMYTPAPEETKVGNLTVVAPAATPQTLAADIWGYTEVSARIVGTENYYIDAYYKVKEGAALTTQSPQTLESKNDNKEEKFPAVAVTGVDKITFAKSGKDNEIVVAYLDENDQFVADKVDIDDGDPATYKYVPKTLTISLDEVKLESYTGKTDDLIARDLKLFINKEGEYFSSTLQGRIVDGIVGAYGVVASVPTSDLAYTHGGNPNNTKYATSSFKIDGVEYVGENFAKVRNLTFLPGGRVLSTPTYGGAHETNKFYVDDNMNLINRFYYEGIVTDAGALTDPETGLIKNTALYDYKYNFPSVLQRSTTYVSTRKGIDSDGDGYYDYVTIAFSKAYIVTSATKSTIKLQPLTDETCEMVYSGDKFHSELDRPKEGDVIIGYVISDDFYHETTTKTVTGFATKVASNGSSVTLYGQGTLSAATNLHNGRVGGSNVSTGRNALSAIVNKINATSNFVGFDSEKGDYNYVTYYLYNGNYVYATIATESEKKAAMGGQNKAILQFVDKPTELQINEKTKKYEVFYPAYLLINGKEELVNLKPTAAINGTEAETVAQNGSMYRAYVKDGIVMYPNVLVEFVVDSDGYYSLTTRDGTSDSDVTEDGVVTGKVIAANKIVGEGDDAEVKSRGLKLVIDEETGVMSIFEGDKEIATRITTNASSIIYYPYTDEDKTGAHEYIDFCLGEDVPAAFDPVDITGDTYLAYDNEAGLWVIETTMLALDGFEGVTKEEGYDNYKKDARVHLIALANSDAEYDAEAEAVCASYVFKNIYEGTDVITLNKEIKYADATKATLEGIYAWDSEEKDYVLIKEDFDSYSVETINSVISSLDLVYTDDKADGYKLQEGTKIIAITNRPNADNEEFTFEEISIGDVEDVLETIEVYNEYYNSGADYTMTARIGTYVDENRKTQLAYIIIDWVEYNAELDAYTFAGIK